MQYRCPPGWWSFALIVFLIVGFLELPVHAQMVTGENMDDFAKVFSLEGAQADGWTACEIACSVPANVLWPNDEATFTFRIENKSDQAIQGPGKVHVVHYGTRGRPGDVWKPQGFKTADVETMTVEVNAPAQTPAQSA